MSNLIHVLSNSTALEQDREAFFSDVRDLGETSAGAEEALPNLAICIVKAVAAGLVGEADVKAIYEQYTAAQSSRLVHTDKGKSANTSKLRQIIKASSLAIFHNPKRTAVHWFDDVIGVYIQMRAEKLKVKSAYAGYVDVCRAQLASPTCELTEQGIRDVLATEVKDKGGKDFLKTAVKALEKALEAGDLNDAEKQSTERALGDASNALNMLTARHERAEKMAAIAAYQAELDAMDEAA